MHICGEIRAPRSFDTPGAAKSLGVIVLPGGFQDGQKRVGLRKTNCSFS